MLLRSITKHVRDQNWFAVALDFLIVVTGILIAFQITNWSEARADRAQEQQIIVRLQADFELLGRWTDEKITFFESITDDIAAFEQLIISYPKGGDIQAIQNFYETSFNLPRVTGQSDTYEQLVASGDMKLITNDALRAELVGHAALTRTFIHQDQAVREWGRPYLTSLVRLGMLIEVMPLEEVMSEAGSKADLIVSAGMYQSIFEGQLSVHKAHKESFTKLSARLASEKNK